MSVIFDNADLFWSGMRTTISLTLVSALAALVLGVLRAACRVSPVIVSRLARSGQRRSSRKASAFA